MGVSVKDFEKSTKVVAWVFLNHEAQLREMKIVCKLQNSILRKDTLKIHFHNLTNKWATMNSRRTFFDIFIAFVLQ